MPLTEHLKAIRIASTPEMLEDAFQAALSEFRGRPRTRGRICKAMRERGLELCAYSEDGTLVPRYESRRRLLRVAGESYRVAKGDNSTGVRYAWHYATEWARGVLRKHNLDEETIATILDWWSEYPHRALRALS